MRKTAIISSIAAFASACGPHVDDEEHPHGELALEHEDSRGRLYRLDRRVEGIYERDDGLEEKWFPGRIRGPRDRAEARAEQLAALRVEGWRSLASTDSSATG